MSVLSIKVFEELFSCYSTKFRSVFSRSASFEHFRLDLLTSMTTLERKGVTDTARLLPPEFDFYGRNCVYERMIKFFKRSNAFDHHKLWTVLAEIIRDSGYLHKDKVEDRSFIVIDGHNAIKSGRFMPCVSRITQSSETPTKPKNTFGHLIGSLGVLAGSEDTKLSCFLIGGEIQNGENEIRMWNNDDKMVYKSHVEKMIKMACDATATFGNSYCYC